MSTYHERYDDALSQAPWVAKATGGRTLLFKYAPYPERKGYLFAATDLETVYFEAVLGASVATRLAQVSEREGKHTDAGMEQAEAALVSLADAFDGGWSAASVGVEADDYFDEVYFLRCGDFAWQFNMTEMRGRQPLTFIAKHLLSPFSVLMAQDRGVEPSDSGRAVDAVAAVLSDSGVARALRRVTGAPPPASGKATPAISRMLTPAPRRERTVSPATPAAPAPRRTPSPERTPLARPPTPPRAGASQSLPPMIPPSSPTPAAKRTRAYDYAAGILPSSSGPDSPGLSTDTGPDRSRSTSPLKRVLVAASTDLPRSVPPIPPSDPPSSSFDPPSSTQDPLIPTQTKKKKKKDKKAEEAEEEAEADKRRAEMKRRMASGGGGRLGRRR